VRRIVWIVALIVGASFVAGRGLRAEETAEKAAEAAAKAWLALVDAGNYTESWSQASSLFRKQLTVDQWKSAVRSAREPFGRVLSRQVESARYTKSLPGAPDGEYVVIQYDTSFEKKKSAVETVTPMKDTDGVWRVSGYYVK
jgi:Protein of unknown function (DUF4019)